MIIALIQTLRPKQWTKNILLFAAYLFTLDQEHNAATLIRVLAAFGLFCAMSGGTYIFNDVLDRQRDSLHPRKCKRPIACGRLPVAVAVPFGLLLVGGVIYASFLLSVNFGLIAAGYALLSLSYSLFLKHVVVVDVLTIAAGFVLRAVAGAVVIDVQISPWLLVCTTLLALFLGFAKRRSELLGLEDGAEGHRKTLSDYSESMLDQMLNISASAALMAYFLYSFSPNSETAASHPYMMLTVPFVIFGLFRYLYLLHARDAGKGFEMVLLEDRPMLINIILWAAVAAVAMKLTS